MKISVISSKKGHNHAGTHQLRGCEGKVLKIYKLNMAVVVVYFTMARMTNLTEHTIPHSYHEFLRPLVREDAVKSIQGG